MSTPQISPEKLNAMASEFGKDLTDLVNRNLQMGTPMSVIIYRLGKIHFSLQLQMEDAEQAARQEMLSRAILKANGTEKLPPPPGADTRAGA